MDVKAGYKQTEVGVIPKDWDIVTLGDVCVFENGDRSSNYPSPTDFVSSGIPFVNAGHVSEGKIDITKMDYIKPESYARLTRGRVKEGDILYCLRGSLGKFGMVRSGFGDGAIASSLVIIRPRAAIISRQYLLCYFGSFLSKQMIETLSGGAAQPNLGVQDLSRFLIPLPSTHEQEAIVEALSDVDAYIESLEQLITKKRLIKQGAMQELLTGKRRLPGFSGNWEERKLGEIVEIVSGGTPSTRIAEYWNGPIDWCTPTDITSTEGKYLTHTEKHITEAGLKNSSANLLPKGTLLLCSRATIGEVKIATDRICTNQGFKSLVCSDQVYNEFLYYITLTLKPKLLEKGIGSTFLEISKKDTASIEIKLPSFEEQTAITTILSDMDAELEELESKLTKARQLKQGMMQELLTGRIRLI